MDGATGETRITRKRFADEIVVAGQGGVEDEVTNARRRRVILERVLQIGPARKTRFARDDELRLAEPERGSEG